ncbi:putative transmembrane protein [Toxoplasma gondii TgCatPRC2]|uniref:Transmembrane protein n=2 Tax=Toxoplasma gondii TaxID=5811 RepID=S8EWN1_TOXGM|nr:hypothetical protein TGME49_288045 [Toxoplasma gondii ME49]EPT27821.1 hypothetical protein TGME49_288045 [Toxoplasma gondii ME49]KYK69380.1 putative transmembrane protein [Toxoplasma gondii TgCatPRC2]|eukprot:XP_018636344.1 hypothetical protein TGME49_288045 [Toxoplasma gondii ME49]
MSLCFGVRLSACLLFFVSLLRLRWFSLHPGCQLSFLLSCGGESLSDSGPFPRASQTRHKRRAAGEGEGFMDLQTLAADAREVVFDRNEALNWGRRLSRFRLPRGGRQLLSTREDSTAKTTHRRTWIERSLPFAFSAEREIGEFAAENGVRRVEKGGRPQRGIHTLPRQRQTDGGEKETPPTTEDARVASPPAVLSAAFQVAERLRDTRTANWPSDSSKMRSPPRVFAAEKQEQGAHSPLERELGERLSLPLSVSTTWQVPSVSGFSFLAYTNRQAPPTRIRSSQELRSVGRKLGSSGDTHLPPNEKAPPSSFRRLWGDGSREREALFPLDGGPSRPTRVSIPVGLRANPNPSAGQKEEKQQPRSLSASSVRSDVERLPSGETSFSGVQVSGNALALAAGLGGVILGSSLGNGYPLAGVNYPFPYYNLGYPREDCAIQGEYPGACTLTTLQLILIIMAVLFCLALCGIAICCWVTQDESGSSRRRYRFTRFARP